MAGSPQAVAEGFAAAWDAADADALAGLFVEDADFVNVVGLWWRTRTQIRDKHAYGFLHMFPNTTMTLQEVAVRDLGSDVAVVHAAWTMTGQITPTGEPAGERSGVLSFTVTRQPDRQWLAVSAQNTDRIPDAQTHLATEDTLTTENYTPRHRRRRH